MLRATQIPKVRAGGFTLIELLIVIGIIAILAAIAIPSYTQYITRSKLTEAQYALQDYRVRMEQFFQDNRNYGAGANCGVAMTTSTGAARFFDFSCTRSAGPPEAYTATATGRAAQGVGGFVFTITADNTRRTTAVPRGWGTAPLACWVVRKGGGCT
ncbi:type IV pilus assembly protein PilE [Tahibacter aquaticus]|uniref:Type IV pilus assembly protein PilE n=2 Tax=Tahibacter aquaticus TaxID=520092 RepID=A0A4R6Z9M5_9GAMM|nr:type IV pilus assembly protein PilE [Tahibacter aquaticus]